MYNRTHFFTPVSTFACCDFSPSTFSCTMFILLNHMSSSETRLYRLSKRLSHREVKVFDGQQVRNPQKSKLSFNKSFLYFPSCITWKECLLLLWAHRAQNTDHLQFHSTISHLHIPHLLIIQNLVFLQLEAQQIWQVTSKLAAAFLGL